MLKARRHRAVNHFSHLQWHLQVRDIAITEVSASEHTSEKSTERREKRQNDESQPRATNIPALRDLEANVRWPEAGEQAAWERSPTYSPLQGLAADS